MNSIVCPHCGKEVEISEAIKHQIQESILAKAEIKHKEELEKLKIDIEEKAEKRIKEELELKFRDSQNELAEAKEQGRVLREQLLEITKELRLVRQKDEDREQEMQNKLLKEEEKIRVEAQKRQRKNNTKNSYKKISNYKIRSKNLKRRKEWFSKDRSKRKVKRLSWNLKTYYSINILTIK